MKAAQMIDEVRQETKRRWIADKRAADEMKVAELLKPTDAEIVATATDAGDGEHQDDEMLPVGLGEDFWTALPFLEHVRRAAQARRVAPSALLASVLTRIAAWTPPTYCVPPFVGGTVPLSLMVALVDTTGGGKSAQERAAAALLPDVPAGCFPTVSLGSGEGAVEAYLERYTDKDDNGRNVTKSRQAHYGGLFTLDEGRVLTEIGSRSGSTIVPTLCTMWTGGDLGQQNASAETRRRVAAGGYVFGLVSLWQPSRMAGLFDDTDGGLPGRFLFLEAADRDAPDVRPADPGPLKWCPLPRIATDAKTSHRPLTYPRRVAEMIDDAAVTKFRGVKPPPLEAHRNLNLLKLSGTLAIADTSGTDVSETHWELAEQMMAVSDRTRGEILAGIDIDRRRRLDSSHSEAGRREVAKVTAVESKALSAASRAVARKAHRLGTDVIPKRELSQAIKGTDRRMVGADAAIEEAERLGYIVAVEGGWTAGEARPAT